MEMDIFLAVCAGLLLLTGLAGTFLPVLPGVPLAWCGLLVAHFCKLTLTPVWILITTLVITIIVTVADSILQPYLTKRSGGSKASVWGSTIGLFVSLFLGPVFIILAPLIGAFIGELIHDSSNISKAFKAALGSFFGFLLGSGIKMSCVIAFIWIFVFELIK